MTVPDPTYITVDEVKEQSLIAELVALEDANIEKLIQKAEDQIDAYVGAQPHHPRDTNTDRVFPRDIDYAVSADGETLDYDAETPVIPYKVSRACLLQVEWLYTQWWNNRETEMAPVEHDASAVSIGGDGSYSETRTGGGTDFSAATLCNEAKALLRGSVARFSGIDVTDPDLTLSPS